MITRFAMFEGTVADENCLTSALVGPNSGIC